MHSEAINDVRGFLRLKNIQTFILKQVKSSHKLYVKKQSYISTHSTVTNQYFEIKRVKVVAFYHKQFTNYNYNIYDST